jgi:hypothetical protein
MVDNTLHGLTLPGGVAEAKTTLAVSAPQDVDLVRGLLRAGGNASPPPARASKILPRRVVKAGRAAVTLLDVALAAIEDASAEQLVRLEAALAARRAA